MTAPNQVPTKQDVLLAEIKRKAERDAIIFRGLVTVAIIVALYFPLTALRGIVEPLAGQTTKVDVDVVTSIVIAASMTLNGFQYLRRRAGENE